MQDDAVTLRKKIIFEVIISAAVALIAGALLLLFAIEQYRQTLLHGSDAQPPLFMMAGVPVSWSMILVALCAAISFTGTVMSTSKLTKLAKTFSSSVSAGSDPSFSDESSAEQAEKLS